MGGLPLKKYHCAAISAIHSGLTKYPEETILELFEEMVWYKRNQTQLLYEKVLQYYSFFVNFLVMAQTPKLVMDFNPVCGCGAELGTNFLQVEDKIFIVVDCF